MTHAGTTTGRTVFATVYFMTCKYNSVMFLFSLILRVEKWKPILTESTFKMLSLKCGLGLIKGDRTYWECKLVFQWKE